MIFNRDRNPVISDDVLNQILCAPEDDDKNIYVKACIVILNSTGIAVRDFVNLDIDSLDFDPFGSCYIGFHDKKNRPISGQISDMCAGWLGFMEDFTNNLRNRADEDLKKYLFLIQSENNLMKLNSSLLYQWTDDFIKKNEIKDSDGNIINLKLADFHMPYKKKVIADIKSPDPIMTCYEV